MLTKVASWVPLGENAPLVNPYRVGLGIFTVLPVAVLVMASGQPEPNPPLWFAHRGSEAIRL